MRFYAEELKSLMGKPADMVMYALLAIAFIFIYKMIRCKFKIRVNCWFCNQNMRVAYKDRNGFYCASCDQYNGFAKDGDYNVDIIENSRRLSKVTPLKTGSIVGPSFDNRLCELCNRQQEIKVKKLAAFDVDLNSDFDRKFEQYKKKLEENDVLCNACTSLVDRTLNEKKKLIFLYKKNLDINQARSFVKPSESSGSNNAILRRICFVALIAGVSIICIEYILKLGIYYNLLDEAAFRKLYASYVSLPLKYLEKTALFIKSCVWLLFYMLGFRVNSKYMHNFVNVFKGSYVFRSAVGAHLVNYWKLLFSLVAVIFTLPIKMWFRSPSWDMNVSNSFHQISADNVDDSYESDVNNSFRPEYRVERIPSQASSVCSSRSQHSYVPQNFHSQEQHYTAYIEINNNSGNNSGNENEIIFLKPQSRTPPQISSDMQSTSGRRYSVSSIHSPFKMLNVSTSNYIPPTPDAFVQFSELTNFNKSHVENRTTSRRSLILPSKLNVKPSPLSVW